MQEQTMAKFPCIMLPVKIIHVRSCVTKKYTPKHRSIQFLDVAPELLSRGADPDVQDKYGHSPLHRAASKGLEKMTEILLQVCSMLCILLLG